MTQLASRSPGPQNAVRTAGSDTEAPLSALAPKPIKCRCSGLWRLLRSSRASPYPLPTHDINHIAFHF